MTEPLWGHQQKAFDFVRDLWGRGRRGAMLAIVMGGGKSRVAVELADRHNLSPVLIQCPLRVVEVWREQFARFGDGWTFGALDTGDVRERTELARQLTAWSALQEPRGRKLALAINYEAARAEPFATFALSRPWGLCVLDESHRIKSPSGRTSKFCAKLGLRALRRLALTGTPMPHEPTDIWAQFRFLDPYFLDKAYSEFRARYAEMGGYLDKEVVAWRNLDELEARFRTLAFRVGEEALDLPGELDQTLSASFGAEAARIYDEMEREAVAWIEAERFVTAANAPVRLLRLHQIAGGSLRDDQGDLTIVDEAKESLLADLLSDLDEPAVIFALFKPDLQAIHRACRRAGVESLELSGARDEHRKWKLAGAPLALAAQIQAGDVGIDLTRARIAIYYSHGFSLTNYLQSRARIRRPPQTRPCLFYHLQIRNTVDEYILDAVRERRDLIASVVDRLRQKSIKEQLTR